MNAKAFPSRLFAVSLLAFAAACQAPLTTSYPTTVEFVVGQPLVLPAAAPRSAFAALPSEKDDRYFAAQGGLVRVGGHLWDIGESYDGNTVVVVEDNDFVLIPDYDLTAAPEVGFGYRGKRYGWEVTYKRFESEGEFLGGTDDDTWNYLDLDFKQYYFVDQHIQPFLSLGLGYFFGVISDGATDGVVVQDSDFSGISINIGGGVAFYLTERLALDVRAIYRYAETLEVETVSFGDVSIDDGLPADGYGVSFGLSYTVN